MDSVGVWVTSFGGAALVVWLAMLLVERRLKRELRLFTWILGLMALSAIITHHGARIPEALTGERVHVWNQYHYYVGSKYFGELGYFDLYAATLTADDDFLAAGGAPDKSYSHVGRSRDMHSYELLPREEIVGSWDRSVFTEERLAELGADSRWIRALTPDKKARRMLSDLGYNPAPPWVLLGKPVAELVELGGPLYPVITASDLAMVALALLVFAFPAVRIRRLKQRERELASAVEERTRELRELSLRDPLTGLRNRRFLWEVIPTATSELAQLRRGVDEERRGPEPDRVTGFLMVDIDHFKQVNDTHGHAAGDAVLRRLSQLLEESVRSDDIVVRWGGEEFLLVLRRTRPETLAGFADRLRLRVVDERFEIPGGDQVRKSCSVGVCCLPFFDGSAEDLTVEQVIAVADAALYRAKETGRDRIIQVVPGPTEPRGAADLASIQSDLELATVQGLVRLVGAGD